jgi:hypothetical protein
MQVELISMADAVTLGAKHPYVAGSFAKYTARTNEAKKIRQMKVFGCRHCQCRNSEPAIARPARNNDHLWRKRFTFNGLVSHTKEKWVSGILLLWTSSKRAFSYSRHNIFSLGDEDFFRGPLTVADGEHI